MSVADEILAQNLVILASAGSGKTYQLGNRVVGMIGSGLAEPERMVALTFTRKAAGEFADSVLGKLADGTLDEAEAQKIFEGAGVNFVVGEVLEKVVAALSSFELGTMDSFFTKVVRGFQYELGLSGGTFSLLQGTEEDLAKEDLLNGVLGDTLEGAGADEFLATFRRATMGKEDQGVRKQLETYLDDWQKIIKGQKGGLSWRVFDGLPEVGDWEAQKVALVKPLRASITKKELTEKQAETFEKFINGFAQHTVGSGFAKENSATLFGALAEAVRQTEVGENISFSYSRKLYEFDAMESEQWRSLMNTLVACELSAAVQRTQGVCELVGKIDEAYDVQLRRKGLLSFSDVKEVLGEWKGSEEGRLRRELVDYRLDGRYDHWFLDEFQDTSPSEWDALEPLVDEAVSDGSLFVVGDKKQAIYGWRGGDVRLFDQLGARYGDGLSTAHMDESYRSGQPVLDLVNGVCGNREAIANFFGLELAQRWEFNKHQAAEEKRAEAKVEVLGKDEIEEAVLDRLEALEVQERKISVGILVRKGDQVKAYADLLRANGYEVIENGNRKPIEDSLMGILLNGLVGWLANPADDYARGLLEMSALRAILKEQFSYFDEEQQAEQFSWGSAWELLMAQIAVDGVAQTIEVLTDSLVGELTTFSKAKRLEFLHLLKDFDQGKISGKSSMRDLQQWLEKVEVSQPPGDAAVQIMTIHKSKGLGFDAVILPGYSDKQIPDGGRYQVARGKDESGVDWLLDPPAAWVRAFYDPLEKAYEGWGADQQYEELCVLYVALTRAKRGLYVFLDQLPKSRKVSDVWKSGAHLIRQVLDDDQVFYAGDARWIEAMERRKEIKEPLAEVELGKLGKAIPLRGRRRASDGKGGVTSRTGAKFGNEVHALFEQVEWLEGAKPPKSVEKAKGPAANLVKASLKAKEIKVLFDRGRYEEEGVRVEVRNEQALEVLIEGKWVSCVIDRLVLLRGDASQLIGAEIYDYKTDDIEMEMELLGRYRQQMQTYAKAVATVFGLSDDVIKGYLVSTHLKAVLAV